MELDVYYVHELAILYKVHKYQDILLKHNS